CILHLLSLILLLYIGYFSFCIPSRAVISTLSLHDALPICWLVTLWTSYNPRCFRINFKLVHTNIVIRNRSACHLGKVNFKVLFIGVFNRLLAIVSTVNSECVDFICQREIVDKVLTKLCITRCDLFQLGMQKQTYYLL